MHVKKEEYVPGYGKDILPESEKQMILIELRKAMLEAAENLEFEKAAKIRDEIQEFEKDLGMTVA
jgi:excinuclease ABC subunit B